MKSNSFNCVFLVLNLILLSFSTQLFAVNQNPQRRVMLGIDVLEEMNFSPIAGKKIGLLTHPAGVNRNGVSTVEVLRRARNCVLVALFGPEHGIYGDEKANDPVDDRIDERTGLPVYSLYGKYRKPTPKMLSKIETLVIDLQDVGVRSYTYVSCMRYAIEACFQNNVEVIVLDRPNPLGGLKVDGPGMDKEWMSYVGAYQVPYVHGLTIGEMARMSKEIPGWLDIDDLDRKNGNIAIVPMKGWSRKMSWPQTGLKWIPTSPYIPDLSAVAGYSMTGLGAQLGDFRHGIGTPYPFRLLTFKGVSPDKLQQILQRKQIPGLSFRVQNVSGNNKAKTSGVYVRVSDWSVFNPTEISFHMMQLACELSGQNPFASAKENEIKLYNKHVGSTAWWNEISTKGAEARVDYFLNLWKNEALQFQAMSKKYWLYK